MNSSQKGGWKRTSLANRRMVWLTAIVAFATLCLAVASLFQYLTARQQSKAATEQAGTAKEQANSMREQTNTLKSSLDETRKAANAAVTQANASLSQAGTSQKLVQQNEQSVIAAIAQAKAAQGSTATAQDALRVAREQFLRDTRPYVWSAFFKLFDIEPGKKLTANVGFVNYGKSPAVEFRSAVSIFHGQNALYQADLWFRGFGNKPMPHGLGSVIIIPPGIPAPDQQIAFTTAQSDNELSPAEAAYILDTDYAVVFVARLEYFDITGTFYRTDICRFRFRTTAIGGCDKHNEIR
ncbi:MAG: hypothetical protein QOH41_3548 [Blastocatellia bacterium]|nr:hypothetical protein [Blastocatellia bacterium]